jgi:hypothetical protein
MSNGLAIDTVPGEEESGQISSTCQQRASLTIRLHKQPCS